MLQRFLTFATTVMLLVATAPLALALSAFEDQAAGVDLATAGTKDGGLSWGDFNNDGCLDLLVNTADTTLQTRLYQSDCSLPDPTFSDVTATHAAGLLENGITDRSAIWGDVNNDGNLDFAVNTSGRVEIYLSRGAAATPAYSFGDSDQNPNQVLQMGTATEVPDGQNVEGMGWADYEGDGDLDLVIDNHNFGIDIYANDGSGNFTHVTPASDPLGLPTGGTTGDYLTVADFDVDGDVDILARKQDDFDLWVNTGGTFTANTTFDEQAANANKGGVAFCDFDNDADFDLFWTDGGTNANRIWLQEEAGTFTPTDLPSDISGNIDDVVCGDVDNDGDLDLFLTSDSDDLLFINELILAGTLAFTRQNVGITGSGDGEGAAFADYDRDGDLDLLINQDGGNELWRNDTNDQNYLFVRALRAIPNTDITRDDIGATVTLLDSAGEPVSPVREVNGGRGHGAQDPVAVHFGLPDGPDATYTVRVQFVGGTVVQKRVVPGDIGGYQLLEVTNTDEDDPIPSEPEPGDNPIGLAKEVVSQTYTGFREHRVIYRLTVANLGNAPLTAVQVRDDLSTTFERASAFAVNSVTSADLSVRPDYDGQNVVDLLTGDDTLDAGQRATITLDVTITLPRVSGFFVNTATAGALGPGAIEVEDLSTDGTDPDPDGDGDPTNNSVPTPVALGLPGVSATTTYALAVDAKTNGEINPGDTLAYTVVISNAGPGSATGVRYSETLDPNTTLVGGSVSTTKGTISTSNANGDTAIIVEIGDMAVAQSVTITFRVRINDPLPQGVTTVASQGEVRGDNITTTPTDDPTTPEIGDATRVRVVVPAANPDPGPGPGGDDEGHTLFLPIIAP